MEMRQSRQARRAMRRVFTTVEVFERILLSLDIQELLLVQLVHTHFKRFIDQSAALQRKLFFTPDPARTKPVLNPLLKARFPALLSLKRPVSAECFYKLNSIICELDWYRDEFYRERMLRADASWRRMFPVQPPAKLESIKIYTHDSCINQFGRCIPARLGSQYQRLQQPGIKMGLLYDLIVHMNSLEENPYPEFYLHWQMFLREPGRDTWQESFLVDEEPDPLGHFVPLYANDDEDAGGTQNSLVLYYQHYTGCSQGDVPDPLLKIDSPFLAMVERDRTTLFDFLKDPNIRRTAWVDYVTPGQRAQIDESKRRQRR